MQLSPFFYALSSHRLRIRQTGELSTVLVIIERYSKRSATNPSDIIAIM